MDQLKQSRRNNQIRCEFCVTLKAFVAAETSIKILPNFLAFGNYLHYLQDTYSHAGFYNSNIGHAGALHYFDKTDSDPERAMRMVGATWSALKGFAASSGCKCEPIWNDSIARTAWDFVRTPAADFGALNSIDSTGGLMDFGLTNPSGYLDRKIRILGVSRR